MTYSVKRKINGEDTNISYVYTVDIAPEAGRGVYVANTDRTAATFTFWRTVTMLNIHFSAWKDKDTVAYSSLWIHDRETLIMLRDELNKMDLDAAAPVAK